MDDEGVIEMPPTPAPAASESHELSSEESRAYIEELTRRYYQLSVEDFIRAAEANELPDHPALAHLILLTGARSESC